MEIDLINEQIGNKIKNLRIQCGLTQQELADRTELTKGFISQLERGQVSPSVVTLFDLIECLGTTPGDFFQEKEEPQIVFKSTDFFEKTDENGNMVQWIVPTSQGNEMEPLLCTLQPHMSSSVDTPHAGEEFGYILSGRLTIHLGDRKHEAKAGDSFYYEADKEHWIENPGSRPCKYLWVSTPPSF